MAELVGIEEGEVQKKKLEEVRLVAGEVVVSEAPTHPTQVGWGGGRVVGVHEVKRSGRSTTMQKHIR